MPGSNRSKLCVPCAVSLARNQRRGFLRDVALPGLDVACLCLAAHRLRARRFLRLARCSLTLDEVVVRGEVRQALADELANVRELLVGHELGELFLELADDLVAAQHRAGA